MPKEQITVRPETRPIREGEVIERGRTTPDRPIQPPRSNSQPSSDKG